MTFECVIFDLDGTLLDTLDDIADSANHVLRTRGQPTHPVDAYRTFVGDGIEMLMTRVLPQSERNVDTVRQCVSEFRSAYRRNWNAKTRPYEGISNLLQALSRRRLRLAVLSNKPDDFTKRCVAELLAPWRFDFVAGDRAGVARKPDPAGAKDIAERLGIAVERALYVGDSGTDMRAASAAGMFPVGALWGFRSREELERCGARALIARPMDLLGLLGD